MKKYRNKILLTFTASILLLSSGISMAAEKQKTENNLIITQISTKPTKTNAKKVQDMLDIEIVIGSKVFDAKFYNNDTSKALIKQMPLTITMNELNGNEKYYDLKEKLPSKTTVKPKTIQNGEIMLWSSKTLVLFYDTFSNQYGGYVKLGYLTNPQKLADALGDGNIKITFRQAK